MIRSFCRRKMGANCCRPTRYFQTKRAGGDSGYTRQIWSENADEAFNDFDGPSTTSPSSSPPPPPLCLDILFSLMVGVDSEEELRTYGRLWCMPACCLWSYAGVTCFKNMTNCTNDRRFLYMRYPFCCCHSKEGLEDKHFLKDPNNAKSERATNHQNVRAVIVSMSSYNIYLGKERDLCLLLVLDASSTQNLLGLSTLPHLHCPLLYRVGDWCGK